MSLKTVTRNLDKAGLASVYIQYSYNGRSKRFATGVKVHPEGFEDGEIVKCVGAAWKEHNASIASRTTDINTVSNALEKLIRRYKEDNHVAPTPEALEELYEAPKKASAVTLEKQTFWQLYAQLQAQLEEKAERGTARTNTVRGLKALKSRLHDFEQAQGIRLSLQAFDYNVFNSFNEFLQREGYRNSTIRTRIARLKAVLNVFVKLGFTKNVAWREFKFDTNNLKDQPLNQRIFALSEAEFQEWMGLEFGRKHRLEYARDLFILSASTGLRWSDAKRVGPANIIGDTIVITTKKTREELTIDINKYSRMILDKYPNGMKHVDLNHYNERLRVVAEQCASLHKPFQKIVYSGGLEIQDSRGGEVKKKRYEFISSHTGRKTFVCLCLIKGIPEFKIRSYTGHKDLSSFARYVDSLIGGKEFMAKFDL